MNYLQTIPQRTQRLHLTILLDEWTSCNNPAPKNIFSSSHVFFGTSTSATVISIIKS